VFPDSVPAARPGEPERRTGIVPQPHAPRLAVMRIDGSTAAGADLRFLSAVRRVFVAGIIANGRWPRVSPGGNGWTIASAGSYYHWRTGPV